MIKILGQNKSLFFQSERQTDRQTGWQTLRDKDRQADILRDKDRQESIDSQPDLADEENQEQIYGSGPDQILPDLSYDY